VDVDEGGVLGATPVEVDKANVVLTDDERPDKFPVGLLDENLPAENSVPPIRSKGNVALTSHRSQPAQCSSHGFPCTCRA
jgi:hypothetical protein